MPGLGDMFRSYVQNDLLGRKKPPGVVAPIVPAASAKTQEQLPFTPVVPRSFEVPLPSAAPPARIEIAPPAAAPAMSQPEIVATLAGAMGQWKEQRQRDMTDPRWARPVTPVDMSAPLPASGSGEGVLLPYRDAPAAEPTVVTPGAVRSASPRTAPTVVAPITRDFAPSYSAPKTMPVQDVQPAAPVSAEAPAPPAGPEPMITPAAPSTVAQALAQPLLDMTLRQAKEAAETRARRNALFAAPAKPAATLSSLYG